MLELLKKFFPKTEKTPVVSNNQDLIEKLSELQYEANLFRILNQPENKLLVLNVYHISFNSLLSSILNKQAERQLASVNVFSYFQDVDDINYAFKRIIPLVEENNINIKVIHDLNEIYDAVKFLKSLGDNYE